MFKNISNKDLKQTLLEYAIRAPSTHNSQPWLFKITPNSCKFYYDPRLKLPEADPHGRDLYISMGCCIENFILAARHYNIFDSVNFGPFNENTLVAEVFLKSFSDNTDPAYKNFVDTIMTRINARGIFKNEQVDQSVVEDAKTVAQEFSQYGISLSLINDKNSIKKIATLTAEGLQRAYQRPSFRREMSHWMKNSFTHQREGIPGYALKMPALLSFILPTIIYFFNIGKKLSQLNYISINSAPLICVITASESSPATWVQIGRLAERLMLEFNSRDWNTSIFVASVEMGDLYKQVQEIVNTDLLPQFLFVVGKVDSVHKLTPRHKLDDKIF